MGIVGKMTIERAEESQQPAAAPAEPSATQVGGVSVPAEPATADRSAATGQAEKATAGGKEAALRAVFGWARRHDSEGEGEDGGGGGGKPAAPGAAPSAAAASPLAPAPAAEKEPGGQDKGKKGLVTKNSKASKASGAKPAGAAKGGGRASAGAQAGKGNGGGGSGAAAAGGSSSAAKASQEERAAAQPAGPGGSSGGGRSSSGADEPNPHAPVGMEVGDYPSQTPVSCCTRQPTHRPTVLHQAHVVFCTRCPCAVQACLPTQIHPTTAPCPPGAGAAGKPGTDSLAPVLPPLQIGKRADDVTAGVPAGGLKPSTEAAAKEEMRKSVRLLCCCCCCLHGTKHQVSCILLMASLQGLQHPRTAAGKGCLPAQRFARADPGAACACTRALQDLSKPGLLARFLQALTGSQQGEDDDEGSSGPPSSSSSSAKGAEGGSQAQQQRGEQGPPASSAATSAQEPPSGMQLAIAAAGLAALPVVAWSEWVLKSTGAGLCRAYEYVQRLKARPPPSFLAAWGQAVCCRGTLHRPPCCPLTLRPCACAGCGLPPGPSGLLGAAEGVSYLVVGGVVLWSLSTKLSSGRGEWAAVPREVGLGLGRVAVRPGGAVRHGRAVVLVTALRDCFWGCTHGSLNLTLQPTLRCLLCSPSCRPAGGARRRSGRCGGRQLAGCALGGRGASPAGGQHGAAGWQLGSAVNGERTGYGVKCTPTVALCLPTLSVDTRSTLPPPCCLQWQTYGYIPSALPDSNCFGQPASFTTAQAPGARTAAASVAAAPPLNGVDSSQVLLLLAAAALRAPRAALLRA